MIKTYLVAVQHSQPRSVGERTQLADILLMSASLPFKIGHFEAVIQEVHAGIRKAYQQADVSNMQRAMYEQNMLVEADVPEVLVPVAQYLLTDVIGKLREKVNPVAIYFWDTAWLGLKEITASQGSKYDVLRKTELKPGMTLRTCRRCGSQMEDVVVDKDKRPPFQWVALGQKTCVCLGHWALI